MKKYGYDDLIAIAYECVSQTGDEKALTKWAEDIGLDVDELPRFADQLKSQCVAAAGIARTAGIEGGEFLVAVYMAGFELGVRFEQKRGIVI